MKNMKELQLMNRLRLQGKMDWSEAVELLGVSESTARRLFTRLEAEGKVIRVYGGVQLAASGNLEYYFERLAQKNIELKQAIAVAAVQQLHDGDIIFCDAGTTVLCFCAELVKRTIEKPMQLQIYTNSLATLEVLSPHFPVVLLGGQYRPNRKDFCGYLAEIGLSRLHMTKSFLGTDGCDMRNYFTTTDFDTARLDEIAIHNSDSTIILADSEKFASSAPVGYAEFSQVSQVITDEKMDAKTKAQLEKFGMEVIAAPLLG